MGHIISIVTSEHINRRLDHWLKTHFPDTPSSHLQKMIRKQYIKVNKKKSDPAYRLQLNDQVSHPKPVNQAAPTIPPHRLAALQTQILAVTEDVIIVNKPAGLAVHSGSGHAYGLIDMLEVLMNKRLHMVHRLDRLTSGVMMIAQHPQAQQQLDALFRTRALHKTYQCVVSSWQYGSTCRLEVPLCRIRQNFIDTSVVDPRGVPSLSHFEVITHAGPLTLLQVHIETGRMHQIRAHCQYLGSPIIGDSLYGGNACAQGMMLLASRLAFTLNGHSYDYSVTWPASQAEWLTRHQLFPLSSL